MPAVVVGITGSTRSGKGTLVKQFREQLLGPHCKALTKTPLRGAYRFSSVYGDPPIVVSCISQDGFFLTEKIMMQLGGAYDCPQALNHEALLQSVQAEMNDPAVAWVLLEGFMAFYDERLANLCNVQIWLEVPYDVARRRRMNTKWVQHEYFDQIIWPNHQAYERRVFSRPGAQERIGVVDATQSFSAILPIVQAFLPALGGPPVIGALQVAASVREVGAQIPVMSPKCRNPDCEYLANADPSVSDGFCCDRCEARFNGEEWAMNVKKKHSACCSSKDTKVSDSSRCAPSLPATFYGPITPGMKCAHPECNYLRNRDPTISRLYCCGKCEGLHKGEPWALISKGKRHYKNCEKLSIESAGGCSSGKGGCKGQPLSPW